MRTCAVHSNHRIINIFAKRKLQQNVLLVMLLCTASTRLGVQVGAALSHTCF